MNKIVNNLWELFDKEVVAEYIPNDINELMTIYDHISRNLNTATTSLKQANQLWVGSSKIFLDDEYIRTRILQIIKIIDNNITSIITICNNLKDNYIHIVDSTSIAKRWDRYIKRINDRKMKSEIQLIIFSNINTSEQNKITAMNTLLSNLDKLFTEIKSTRDMLNINIVKAATINSISTEYLHNQQLHVKWNLFNNGLYMCIYNNNVQIAHISFHIDHNLPGSLSHIQYHPDGLRDSQGQKQIYAKYKINIQLSQRNILAFIQYKDKNERNLPLCNIFVEAATVGLQAMINLSEAEDDVIKPEQGPKAVQGPKVEQEPKVEQGQQSKQGQQSEKKQKVEQGQKTEQKGGENIIATKYTDNELKYNFNNLLNNSDIKKIKDNELLKIKYLKYKIKYLLIKQSFQARTLKSSEQLKNK